MIRENSQRRSEIRLEKLLPSQSRVRKSNVLRLDFSLWGIQNSHRCCTPHFGSLSTSILPPPGILGYKVSLQPYRGIGWKKWTHTRWRIRKYKPLYKDGALWPKIRRPKNQRRECVRSLANGVWLGLAWRNAAEGWSLPGIKKGSVRSWAGLVLALFCTQIAPNQAVVH